MEPLQIVRDNPRHFPPEFETYLESNLHVYDMVEELSLQAKRSRNKYGIDMIVGTIRWKSAITELGTDYKMTNDMTPYLARLFHLRYPGHRIFKMKMTTWERRNDVTAAELLALQS